MMVARSASPAPHQIGRSRICLNPLANQTITHFSHAFSHKRIRLVLFFTTWLKEPCILGGQLRANIGHFAG